jgi:hypothetical protein
VKIELLVRILASFPCILQVLYGINVTVFESDPYIAICFQEAVAQSCQNGIYYEDVVIMELVDVSTSSSDVSTGRSRLRIEASVPHPSGPAVQVMYVISQIVQDYNSSLKAYNRITIALSMAVKQGYFTAYLRGFADILGVDELEDCSSYQVTVLSFTQAPTYAPTSSPKIGLSDASIAAIVICTCFACGIFGLLVCCSAREETETGKPKVNTTSSVAPINSTVTDDDEVPTAVPAVSSVSTLPAVTADPTVPAATVAPNESRDSNSSDRAMTGKSKRGASRPNDAKNRHVANKPITAETKPVVNHRTVAETKPSSARQDEKLGSSAGSRSEPASRKTSGGRASTSRSKDPSGSKDPLESRNKKAVENKHSEVERIDKIEAVRPRFHRPSAREGVHDDTSHYARIGTASSSSSSIPTTSITNSTSFNQQRYEQLPWDFDEFESSKEYVV